MYCSALPPAEGPQGLSAWRRLWFLLAPACMEGCLREPQSKAKGVRYGQARGRADTADANTRMQKEELRLLPKRREKNFDHQCSSLLGCSYICRAQRVPVAPRSPGTQEERSWMIAPETACRKIQPGRAADTVEEEAVDG